MEIERREFTRYMVQENGFEVLSRDLKIVGKLKNISRGGLAYKYTPDNGMEIESETVDILGKGSHRFYLPQIPCKPIYDLTELAENQAFTGTETRVRGLKFIKFTERQRQKLEVLLDNYTTGLSDNFRIP